MRCLNKNTLFPYTVSTLATNRIQHNVLTKNKIIPRFRSPCCSFHEHVNALRHARDTEGGGAVAKQWSECGTWSSPTGEVCVAMDKRVLKR